MVPFKISTKFITIEIFRRGIIFSIASILLTSGVSLCNEEIIIALISIVNKQLFHQDCENYSLFVGVFLILISLFLFYILIINWRKEIYSKVFVEVRKAVDALGTSWRSRIRGASPETLKPLHENAQTAYENGFNFIRDNQAVLDVQTYDTAWNLLNLVGEEIIQLSVYIRDFEKQNESSSHGFDPELANRETEPEMAKIAADYRSFVELIRKKEMYRLKESK